jgi:protein O-GlcNAc transferase
MKKAGRSKPYPHGSGKASERPFQPSTAATGQEIIRLLASAHDHFHHGRLDKAEEGYRSILLKQADHPEAMNCLGLIEYQRGHLESAVVMIGRAFRAEPGNATYPCNLGRVLINLGRFNEAAIVLDKSVRLNAHSAEAHLNFGLALHCLGRLTEAIDEFKKALAIRESYPEVFFNLGNAYFQSSRPVEAISAYEKAISLRPGYAEAYANLGNALKATAKLQEAIRAYRKSLDLESSRPEVFVNLAIALTDIGEPEQAIENCSRALEQFPQWPELHFNLGNALQLRGDLDGAIGSYRRAIEVRSTYAEAYGNLGRALQEKGEIDPAFAAYQRALEINPRYLHAFSNLIYLHAFTRQISPQDQWQLAAKWEFAALSDDERAEAASRRFANSSRRDRKLRVGIVSAELGRHAVAEFLQPVLEKIDRSRFQLILYPTVDRTGPRAEQFRNLADEFYSLQTTTDAAAAAKIRADRIDVLLDTTGHTSNCRLGILAHRAAPVQCTWIGFWASTGLSEMDYCLSDNSLPLEYERHFRERLWRLGHTGNVYRGDASLPESRWEPASDGTVWLGSFNKYSKIREECIALWAKVMHRLPESKLLLADRTRFDHQMHKRILDGFRAHGIENGRIDFSPYESGWERHMQLYDRLDIALDTVPFNSGTTAYDALWMGVPLVALEGDWGGGRMASTVLRIVGRPEWVARTPDEYAAIVTELARDLPLRRGIRKTQRSIMSTGTLCDAAGMANELGIAFEAMFDRWFASRSKSAPSAG